MSATRALKAAGSGAVSVFGGAREVGKLVGVVVVVLVVLVVLNRYWSAKYSPEQIADRLK